MASIKRDDVKQEWEGDSEFPLVCETCLGDNPYVRMTKEMHGKKCQVCETPFTVFAWQAGTKGRMKRVEICRNCAKAKNVCQVCIYDLKYGLPVKVRDRVLRETGSASAAGAVPQSNANRAWYTAQQQRMLEQGVSAQNDVSDLAHAKLSEMAVMQPRYERNMAKLCSFFARGECDRGDTCPFRHEMPKDRNDPMSKQNTKDRFYGTNDPVANKILGKKRRKEQIQAKDDERDGYNKARATLYLRFQGDEPFPHLQETDVRDMYYSYGEIVSVRVQPDKGQAFVEYTQPEACELAISSTNRKPMLGRQLYVAWARAPKRGEGNDEEEARERKRRGGGGPQSAHDGPSGTVVRPLAPPGGVVSNLPLPKISVKLPPEVAAVAAARKERTEGEGTTASSVPRPGVTSSVPRPAAGPKAYYPSADPSRLGTKTASD